MVNPIKGWPKLKRGFLFGQKYPASFQEVSGSTAFGFGYNMSERDADSRLAGLNGEKRCPGKTGW